MALYSELPVYKSSYDLLISIFELVKHFTREYKYTVGESLKKETIDLLTLIYRANRRYDKEEILKEAREQIEIIRLFIRIMKDMKQINIDKFVKVNINIEEVSKQLNGWEKSLKKTIQNEK